MPACPSSVPYLGRTSSIRYASSWRRSPRSRFAIRNLKPSGLRRSTPASLFQQRQGHSARMRPMAVVEVDVAAERNSRLVDAVIGPQIHLLVFDTAPEALEEHVIAPRAPAVHAARNLVLDQDVGEGVTGERAAVSRVDDLRLGMWGQGARPALDAERGRSGGRHATRRR